ncbi:hypothetical protein Tco_0819318 [Tanacetum coccineum]|uniref:Uncharacterized protein n=1 Tax=Tanacetum coccineum TaxID=301880 RepID=A0ABQ5AAU8_9ASTR
MKVEESLNVTFDESPPPTKLSPLVDDDVGEEEAIRKNTKIVNTNNEEDESIEVEEIVNIKESKNHPLDQVIGNLNQRTLRSQAQNHSNFFCFISTIEPKNVNEALKDESWVVAMQEELNQFVANDVWELVPLPIRLRSKAKKHIFGWMAMMRASQILTQQEAPLLIGIPNDSIEFTPSKVCQVILRPSEKRFEGMLLLKRTREFLKQLWRFMVKYSQRDCESDVLMKDSINGFTGPGMIDSGCLRHMTRNMSILLILKKLMEDMLPLELLLGNQSNGNKVQKACDDCSKSRMGAVFWKRFHSTHCGCDLHSQKIPEFSDAGFKPSAIMKRSSVQQRTNHKDFQNYLFDCFLSQEEPYNDFTALKDPSWIEAMQDELLQFKLQLAKIGCQGYTQEDGIDYDEVLHLLTEIEALAILSLMPHLNLCGLYSDGCQTAYLYGLD